jgi:DNA-binding response OmpR family regulator
MNEALKHPSSLLLIATESEWAGRSLESVLMVHGYSVLRTQSGHDALEWARRTKPDAVIVDEHMPGVSGVEICRALRDDPTFDPATPIVFIAGSPVSHVERAAAHAAGAWTVCTQPMDAEIVVAELATFIRAKRAGAAAREASLVDLATGLLSPLGLERWAEQLSARALRNHEPLACVVLMAAPSTTPSDDDQLNEIASAFIESSRAHMRRSDIIGKTSDGRLALLAPDTDGRGVLGLVQRLRSAIEGAEKTRGASRTSADFRAGYCAIDDFASGAVEPSELILRATVALDHASRSAGGELAMGFNQLPVS